LTQAAHGKLRTLFLWSEVLTFFCQLSTVFFCKVAFFLKFLCPRSVFLSVPWPHSIFFPSDGFRIRFAEKTFGLFSCLFSNACYLGTAPVCSMCSFPFLPCALEHFFCPFPCWLFTRRIPGHRFFFCLLTPVFFFFLQITPNGSTNTFFSFPLFLLPLFLLFFS